MFAVDLFRADRRQVDWIALRGNFEKEPTDPPSKDWLALIATGATGRASGLMNANHVYETYDLEFLGELERTIEKVGRDG